MKVDFVVRVIDANKNILCGYVMTRDLPFAPMIGMKLKSNTSTWLWETMEDEEIDPQIQEIVYNVNEEKLFCLFEIRNHLKNSYWTEILQDKVHSSFELNQFETH